MGHAFLYPEPSNMGGRGKKNLSETEGFSSTRLSYARKVLRSDPDLALRVRDGGVSFDKAIVEGQIRTCFGFVASYASDF